MINRKLLLLSTILVIGIAGYILWGYMSSQVEHPKYTIIKSDNNIEIRKYPAQLVAQVTANGTREEAISQGFKALADFIFGNNDISENINMTAPVRQQQSAKIAMTAPVQQRQSDGQWLVEFIMPSKYTAETLPKPKNEKITIIENKGYQSVVIRFSGSASQTNLSKNLSILNKYIADNKISVTDEPIFAFYNPPWTLPPFRRNEIQYELIDMIDSTNLQTIHH